MLTLQVAEQQGKYLAHVLNEEAANLNPWQGGQGSPSPSAAAAAGFSGSNNSSSSPQGLSPTSPSGGQQGSATPPLQPFKYKHLGSMATVGGTNAVIQFGGTGSDSFKVGRKRLNLAGGTKAAGG